jgi:uncharacterized protein with PIN domain/sulfur carrier protein ThiS
VRVELRFYGDLADLAGGARWSVPFGAPRSVKDLVESLGVPHTEVAVLLVDGDPVGFGHPVEAGQRVAVYPPFHHLDLGATTSVLPPPPAPRFVLDVHLGTLARRLRWLGFDCWYATDADDATLADVAVEQQRVLLTRDRQLLMRRQVVHGYLPRSQDPELQTLEVVRRFRLSDELAPGTVCVRCNAAVRPVAKAAVRDRIPPRTAAAFDDYRRCDGCDQVYWAGSHADDLAELLALARKVGRRPPTAAPG